MSIQYHCHDISISMYIYFTYQNTKLRFPSYDSLHSCLASSWTEQTEHFHLLPPNISIQRWYWFANAVVLPIPYPLLDSTICKIITICNRALKKRMVPRSSISAFPPPQLVPFSNTSPQWFSLLSCVAVAAYPSSLSTFITGTVCGRSSWLLRQIQMLLHRSHVVINSFRLTNQIFIIVASILH